MKWQRIIIHALCDMGKAVAEACSLAGRVYLGQQIVEGQATMRCQIPVDG